ncbi:hypothetical protein DEO72_LG1g1684 [Vigna unguiculata]|uniref:Uncharacterized protein n=1 Tax=Vigna unguiculata TaxID=3917 RepID=A0A4D6KNB8_VIGUN|nr:hypothetical protein DEO72_LG1g1684 [Vigna unguiculata]
MKSNKAYLVLMALLLTCIGIKYGVSETETFQQSPLLLFLIAMFSHVLASTSDMTQTIIFITFHVSGIIACETLLWILSAQILWCSIINFLLLLLSIFFFFHSLTQLLLCFINYITHHLRVTPPNALQMPNIELQPLEAHV